MEDYMQRDIITNGYKYGLPALIEKNYTRDKCSYERNYEITHDASEFAKNHLYTSHCKQSAFVRRVPVIRRSSDSVNEQRSPLKLFSRDHKLNDDSREAYSVSSSDISERRSVSPIYSVFSQDGSHSSIHEKNNEFTNGNKYKTGKLTIIFNEHENLNHSQIPQHKHRNYFSPSMDHSPLNMQCNTKFIYPTENDYERYSSTYNRQPSADYSNIIPSKSQRDTRRKRVRTIYTPSQLKKLEDKFMECSFIVGEDRQMLAHDLKLREQQVKIWFQNRRTKGKQEKLQVV